MGLYDDPRFLKLNDNVLESAVYRRANAITDRIRNKNRDPTSRFAQGNTCVAAMVWHGSGDSSGSWRQQWCGCGSGNGSGSS